MRGVAAGDVRRWRAARWHLVRPAADVAAAVDSLVPMARDASAYLSLYARVRGFEPTALDRLVFDERSLRPFPLWKMGTVLAPVEWMAGLEATHLFRARAGARRSKVWRRWEADHAAKAPRLAAALEARPQTLDELVRAGTLGQTGMTSKAELGALADEMAAGGEAVLALSGKTLAEARPAYASPENDGRIPPASLESYAFIADLALNYFRVAGPATRDDFAWWASVSASSARHTIEDLAGLLDEVDLEGERKAHFMLEEDAAQLRQAVPVASEHVAFLPPRDPARMATERGFALLCDPRLAPRLAPRGRRARGGLSGAPSPVLVGGSAVGTWDAPGAGKPVGVLLHKELDDRIEADVKAAASALTQFMERTQAARGTRAATTSGVRRSVSGSP